MDNQKVAKELVAIAKQLTAGEGDSLQLEKAITQALTGVVPPAVLASEEVENAIFELAEAIAEEIEYPRTAPGER